MKHIRTFFLEEDGVASIEYGLLALLIGMAALIGMGALGTALNNFFTATANSL